MGKVNEQLAIEKGLIVNDDNSKYQELVKKYKYLLEYYINSKIDLSRFDKIIKNSDLYIGVNKKYESLNEYLKLEYIYLINNLFVEKLSLEDINKINTNFNKEAVDSELMDIVDKTFKDVIYDNYIKGEYQNIICKSCYGPMVPTNMVDNDSLVLKIYYGKNLIDLDGQEFIELHEKQLQFFHELIVNIKQIFLDEMGIKCEILIEKDIY